MLEIAIGRMVNKNIEDVTLLRQISHGDENALTILYERYGDQLSAYALRILRDHTQADDVLQECLLTIWKKAGSYRGEGRVIAWLFSIVHNKAMKTFRDKRNLTLDDLSTEPQSIEKGPDDRLILVERNKLLSKGMKKLSIEHRTVLDLVFFQGMSLKEVSIVCGIPVGTVKSRLSYAKTALKGVLTRTNLTPEDLK